MLCVSCRSKDLCCILGSDEKSTEDEEKETEVETDLPANKPLFSSIPMYYEDGILIKAI